MMTELNITFQIVNAEASVVQPLTIAAPENNLSRLFFGRMYIPAGRQEGFSGGFFCNSWAEPKDFHKKK
jgi:hypothetical protein